jgi:RNA polymerase sigma-70 factor (ECF subfamily)
MGGSFVGSACTTLNWTDNRSVFASHSVFALLLMARRGVYYLSTFIPPSWRRGREPDEETGANEPHGSAEPSKDEQFARLLATCQRHVFFYLLNILHNAADAEEALQETNLVLWRKFDQYRPGTSFGRWACQIAYFEAMKSRKKSLRREHLFSDEFMEMLAEEAEASLDHLQSRRSALERCLGKLSEDDRQLLFCRYRERATTQSVAAAMGRSVQGTRKALHRIRMALLTCTERILAAEGRA